MTSSRRDLSTVSILLMTRIAGAPVCSMRAMSASSCGPMAATGSTSSSTQSTSATLSLTTFTM